jgi:hypothetical protein
MKMRKKTQKDRGREDGKTIKGGGTRAENCTSVWSTEILLMHISSALMFIHLLLIVIAQSV